MDATLRRRLFVGSLWFLAAWVWIGAAVSVFGLPSVITPLSALAVGAAAFGLYRQRVGRGAVVAPVEHRPGKAILDLTDR
jgi:hypothetical protein